MTSLKKIQKYLDKSEDYLLMTCLGIMAIVLFMQVFFRYVLDAPLTWGEELARYLHVWIALMGIRFGMRYNGHLNICVIYQLFPEKVKYVVNILVHTFLAVCIVVYFPGAIRFFLDQTTILSPAMEANMGILHAPVVLGFIGALIQMVVVVMRNVVSLVESGKEVTKSTKGGKEQ